MTTPKQRIRQLEDKARVLRRIALAVGNPYGHMDMLNKVPVRVRFGNLAAQFMEQHAAEDLGFPLVEGDIVECATNPHHDWGLSIYRGIADEPGPWGSKVFVLQEIGSERIMHMGNESLRVLRFMDPCELLTGKAHQVYEWTRKAFEDLDSYQYRWGGTEIVDDSTMRIWIRPHMFHDTRYAKDNTPETYAQPVHVDLAWGKRTLFRDIKALVEAKADGLEFEFTENPPTRGTRGVARVTRDDLEKALIDL